MPDTHTSFFEFDPNKMFADFPWRTFDVEAMWAAGRRNAEAFSKANRLAVEGAQDLARRNVEIMRQGFEDFSTLLRDLSQPVSAEERIAKNTEYAKHMIEKGVSHGREIAMMATKTGTETADILHKRATEGLDELRTMTSAKAKKQV
jgi:phasin family protein